MSSPKPNKVNQSRSDFTASDVHIMQQKGDTLAGDVDKDLTIDKKTGTKVSKFDKDQTLFTIGGKTEQAIDPEFVEGLTNTFERRRAEILRARQTQGRKAFKREV